MPVGGVEHERGCAKPHMGARHRWGRWRIRLNAYGRRLGARRVHDAMPAGGARPVDRFDSGARDDRSPHRCALRVSACVIVCIGCRVTMACGTPRRNDLCTCRVGRVRVAKRVADGHKKSVADVGASKHGSPRQIGQ